VDLAPTFAQLDHGLVLSRLGGSLAGTVRRLLDAHRFDDPMCWRSRGQRRTTSPVVPWRRDVAPGAHAGGRHAAAGES